MSYRTPLIGLSLFLIVSIALTWPVLVTLQRGVNGSTTPYSAVFSDVSGLRVGDDVRMAGVRVGRIDSIELDDTVARVAFRIESDQVVYDNTEAAITYQNIIGQRYLGLSLGDGGSVTPLPAHAEIPLERTEPSFDISVLLNGFEPLFSVLDPEQVDEITGAIIAALQGDAGSVTTLVAETSRLAESLAEPDRILGDIIVDLDGVINDLATQSGDVDSVIGSARAILAELSAQRTETIESMDSIATTVDRLATLSAEIQPDLHDMLAREPGFTGHYMDNLEEFEYFGRNLPGLLKGLARVSQDGSYLSTYLCNFNVTLIPALSNVIPTLVAQATPEGRATYSPVCG
ncbi:MCE family protein [Rhodococcus sp. 105337]|jgi:phospholipid/cholesterol/gamma-HCH transport system substrate-binding protein|uniref:MlaD family protein n=1 Tax=unclassified Rhodococcus (in: high G+C Gram-positive bacteria) TaxID=192944 RepID=UPI00146E30D2|nr:MCE family protein [Rhodococcus sp. 105337]NME81279.1 MCE family protein [Rhodococcus sp. 105337]